MLLPFVNATSQVVFSRASVKSQDFCKLGFRRRSDVISGQLFIAMVRADKNKSREPLARSLFVNCQSVSCRYMDLLYISVFRLRGDLSVVSVR